MERLVKGDVIILEFPFSDLIQAKRRPALVVKIPKGEDLIVLQITAKSQEPPVEILITSKDFGQGKLKTNSYLRLDKVFSVDKSLIKYKIGSLRQEKFSEIIETVCDYLRS
ncbi:growth inhibitor PemK [Candidatus Pacearchaeota archaeon CG_4_9_14_0_2_um_filter_39_13]|nr:type II toxin-antitoxin system PemK/MazF family toxin [Candidatus Pacearchaeota archaeon]OIO44033.1 MAG: hypothetical protein AUJ64_00760 [Candidatus Pacearchaeota archaeon CG1_02_39_14]PJC44499.1 MAG: growth inhibitor PemK [Candidatus Pacearchaeota archaeon CG_4_9_14_0_2_um_filter_39_13]QBM01492.1 hypothetical protein [uncultured archaeon]